MSEHRCQFPEGVTIKPNGVDELIPCRYEVTEIHKNVTVRIMKCPICGSIDISWFRQDDTEDIIYEET